MFVLHRRPELIKEPKHDAGATDEDEESRPRLEFVNIWYDVDLSHVPHVQHEIKGQVGDPDDD